MSFKIPKIGEDAAFALVAANNQRQLDAVASFFHKDRTSSTSRTDGYQNPTRTSVLVESANATNEATLVTLVNEIVSDYHLHCADAIAHKVADTTNLVTNAVATNLATAITRLNEFKGDYNAHITSTTHHYNSDGTNTITNANATDQTTANTLANEAKGDLNAHMNSTPAGAWIEFA